MNQFKAFFASTHLTSSSRSSKYCSHWRGTTSLKPSRKARVCSSTPRENLHSIMSLHETWRHLSNKTTASSRDNKKQTTSARLNKWTTDLNAWNAIHWTSLSKCYFFFNKTIEVAIIISSFDRTAMRTSYLMYSSLFSSVTGMFDPFSFNSIVSTLPSTSKSIVKSSSSAHSSMSLSLRQIKQQQRKHFTKQQDFGFLILRLKKVYRKDLCSTVCSQKSFSLILFAFFQNKKTK